MEATDFTRDDCMVGHKHISYTRLERDYRCNDCGHTFDAFQRMSADVLTECPECGKSTSESSHCQNRLLGTLHV